MESGNSPSSDGANVPRTSGTGRLTEAEREALRQRAAQARAAAALAIERYVLLRAQAQQRLEVTAQRLVAIEATREMLQDSVQRYAQLMKALEIPPERVLSLVNETLQEQLPHPEQEEETRALAENVVTWCIEAYFLESSAA